MRFCAICKKKLYKRPNTVFHLIREHDDKTAILCSMGCVLNFAINYIGFDSTKRVRVNNK